MKRSAESACASNAEGTQAVFLPYLVFFEKSPFLTGFWLGTFAVLAPLNGVAHRRHLAPVAVEVGITRSGRCFVSVAKTEIGSPLRALDWSPRYLFDRHFGLEVVWQLDVVVIRRYCLFWARRKCMLFPDPPKQPEGCHSSAPSIQQNSTAI